MTTIRVNGYPAPQGSKRIVNGRMIESSRALPAWREAIRSETQREMNSSSAAEGPLRVELLFLMPRPKSHFGVKGIRKGAPTLPAVAPDIDKLARAVLDGLTQGGAIEDDSLVTTLVVKKVYADNGNAGVVIRVLEDVNA